MLDELIASDSREVDVLAEALIMRSLLPRLGVTDPAAERLDALERAEQLAGDGQPWLRICAVGMQSVALLGLGREDEAYARLREALRQAEELGSPSLLVRLRLQLARMERRRSGPSAAVHLVEAAQQDAIAAAETPFELEAMICGASILYDDGRWRQALELYEAAYARARRTATQISADACVVALGTIRLMRGEFEAGRRTIAHAGRLRSEFFAAIAFGTGLACEGALGIVRSDDVRFDEVSSRLASVGRRNAAAFADVFRVYARVAEASLAQLPVVRSDAARLAEIEDDRDIEILAEGAVRFANERMPDGPRLAVAEDAAWFQVDDGDPVDLSTRHVLRRLLQCLVDEALQGRSDVDVHALVEAGWPGEIIEPDAAASRVYTSIRYLRKLGLRELLVRAEDGYTIDHRVSVRRV